MPSNIKGIGFLQGNILTDEVTGVAQHLGSVDSPRVSVRHVQLPCDRVGGEVVTVSRIVAVEGKIKEEREGGRQTETRKAPFEFWKSDASISDIVGLRFCDTKHALYKWP